MSQPTSSPLLTPGFADPVSGSQYVFRRLLEAMSRPGRIEELALDLNGPEALDLAATAIALSLVDFESPLFLAEALRTDASEAYLKFHCGTRIITEPAEAAFAILDAAPEDLEAFDLGTNEYPESGATLIIQVETIAEEGPLTLSGPGVNGTETLGLPEIPESFWAARAKLARHFPRGLDLIFVSGARMVALPRTTAVTHAHSEPAGKE